MSDEVELLGFSPFEAERMTSRRVCAQCWSDLSVVRTDGEWTVQVICQGCGESVEITGHISRNTPGIMMENARFAYHEVKSNLRDLFPTLNAVRKSESEIIKELGF